MKVKVRYESGGLKEDLMNLVNLPRVGEQLILKGDIVEVTQVTFTPDNDHHQVVIDAKKVG